MTAQDAAVLGVRAVGVLVVGFGVWGLARPVGLIALLRRAWATPRGKWIAVTFRALFAAALWGAAPVSAFPTVLRVLAAVSLLSALTVLAMDTARERAFVEWWARRSAGALRLASAAALAFGAFVIFAVR